MRLFARIGLGAVCAFTIAAVSGCRPDEEADEPREELEAAAAPAGVVRLSQEAQELIGLSVEPVQIQALPDVVAAAGWLRVIPGRQVAVKAPATGYYVSEQGDSIPKIGDRVAVDERIGTLRVFLTPQDAAQLIAAKEEADILISQSLVTLRLAEAQLEKLKDLPEGAVKGVRVMELQEAAERARVAYTEAKEKLPYLPQEPYEENLNLKTVVLDAPLSGHITDIDVSPRQLVVQGDRLLTVSDWSSFWIEVPVFQGDLPRVQQDRDIQVRLPGIHSTISAKPVAVRQPTEPGRRTVDLLYEIDNSADALRPGQSVEVSLPAGGESNRLVVPLSAVVWDGMGNSWVYLKTGTDSFRRRRIELGQQADGIAVVERGLKEHQEIVTVGAEALFGEEFKEQIQLEDDD